MLAPWVPIDHTGWVPAVSFVCVSCGREFKPPVAPGACPECLGILCRADVLDRLDDGAVLTLRSSGDHLMLGQLAVQLKMISKAQLAAALQEQARTLLKKGVAPSLGRILVDLKFLEAKALEKLLKEQQKRMQRLRKAMMRCPRCKKQYRIEAAVAGRARCPRCTKDLKKA